MMLPTTSSRAQAITELQPVSLVSCLPSLGTPKIPQGYYRSKLFIAPFANNILVAAAGPLLSLLERLCLSPSLPAIDNIRANIEHELFAFHSKLNTSKYTAEISNIAYYLLTATIDEILGKSYLRLYQSAAEFKAFTPLTQDGAQPQRRFFEILHFIKEKPNQYLDLIELVYFCLIVGFEGEYHIRADGRQMLDNTIEELYQVIQKYRFHKEHRLLNEHTLSVPQKKNNKKTLICALIVTAVLCSVLLTSHLLLELKAKKLLFAHSQLAMLEE